MIYIIGAGAVGLSLAAYLTLAGRDVILLRARPCATGLGLMEVTVRDSDGIGAQATLRMGRLDECDSIEGVIVIAAKTHANEAIARGLAMKDVRGPIVLMQNGIGIERPFTDSGSSPVFRSVLYMSSQKTAEDQVIFRQISPSPIGVVRGDPEALPAYVCELTTPQFSFRAEPDIERHVWKKVIVNAVFNSICPLLNADNGVFVRSSAAASLAQEIAGECVPLSNRYGVLLTVPEIMEQVMAISRGSQGVLISTLQDINHRRPTEIDAINLELARMAGALIPPLAVPKTSMLGHLVATKSALL